MVKKAPDIAPGVISRLKDPGMHFIGYVSGLALRINKTGARNWILRATVGSKRRDIGLGAFPEVTVARAKEIAAEKRQQIRNGIDPVAAREAAQMALKADQASFITFREAAKQYIAAHEAGWKNLKHAAQWRTTLEAYAYPEIGDLHVRDVALPHVQKIIEPIWHKKTETANRLRGRIEKVLDWATARGFRSGQNPARWRSNLDMLLPAKGKIAKVQHHAALEWHQCGSFMAELRQQEGFSARALEFCILTACRSGEARLAKWSEFDFDRKVWTIPAVRMKAGKEHRVPLSAQAMALLNKLPREEGTDLLFPNGKGTCLSDMALTMLLRRMTKNCTTHGFRSTFRDWAGETTAFPREVIEHALAHQLKDKAEAAYARGDMFMKRTLLMQAWADFIDKPAAGENIVSIARSGTDVPVAVADTHAHQQVQVG
ncbi:MAG: integrase arm-type DNA-binding domain-containing protein [Alphaproteobacteria bacterium]|nr:integrase arm-type DNA-binding domain-containing protein [Alphaproteobacteria bacterium]